MFKDEYQAAFSKITASEETRRRIMNMANQKKTPTKGRLISKMVLAPALICLLVFSAGASEVVRSWFADYFQSRSEMPMQTEQVAFINENQQNFDQIVTVDGITMELKSAVTDGNMAYICFAITAPENIILNETNIEGYAKEKPTLITDSFGSGFLKDQQGNQFVDFMSMSSVEDCDGLANTQYLVVQLISNPEKTAHAAFSRDCEWTLHFKNLIAKYVDEAYHEKLLTGKYQNQENFIFTSDEEKLLYPEVTLAEGEWDFKIRFEDPDVQEIELISQPVLTRANMGWDKNGENVYTDVEITSFVLRSLSATIHTENRTFAPDFSADGDIFVVMADGSRIRLLSEGGGPGEQEFRAELPVLLASVQYVLLPDGTRIPVAM